jgi:tagatose-1,6-bisphosphate aldolase non-catalytic subunit AgaZ/GatZ
VRSGEIRNHPNDLIQAHIHYVLEDYIAACG